MAFIASLDDIVLFDVADERDAERLCELLQRNRLSWLYDRERIRYVAAALRAEPEDLVSLLRTVETWVCDNGFGGIRYELDGRAYFLRAPVPTLEPAAL
jgi:hypothetical protein